MKQARCLDCGQEINPAASTCEHCGLPTWLRPSHTDTFNWSAMTRTDRALLVLRVIGSALVIAMILGKEFEGLLR